MPPVVRVRSRMRLRASGQAFACFLVPVQANDSARLRVCQQACAGGRVRVWLHTHTHSLCVSLSLSVSLCVPVWLYACVCVCVCLLVFVASGCSKTKLYLRTRLRVWRPLAYECGGPCGVLIRGIWHMASPQCSPTEGTPNLGNDTPSL